MNKKEKISYNGGLPERLDSFLTQELYDYSRSFLKKLIEKGAVKVNGVAKKPSFMLENPCDITIDWPESEPDVSGFKELVIFEDDTILVVNKPAGLLVHPTSTDWETSPHILYSGEKTLAGILLTARPELKGIPRAGIVHRLDRDTSGVMIVAKTKKACSNLLKQFHDRKVNKTYHSIATGEIPDQRGIIDVPIGRISGGKIKASPMGRAAVTEYNCLDRKNGYTYVELFPKTGRTNQIRVHLAWLGYPVLGDTVYGKKPVPRLMLHSRKLEITRPGTKERVAFEAPLPDEFRKIWFDVTGSAI
ncbi:MAG: RluA family pseudouridine synthase [Elusimicrobiaceae bacterium]